MEQPDQAAKTGPVPSGPLAIEDYAIIGDCSTCAVVGRNGSIDWLCWPRFDSPACFSALLGDSRNGRWLIAPSAAEARVTRCYRGDSLILETLFETADGSFAVIDFMPPFNAAAGATGNSSVVRIVEGRSGRVAVRTELVLRFDYGASTPWVVRLDEWLNGIIAIAGPNLVILRTPVAIEGRDMANHWRVRHRGRPEHSLRADLWSIPHEVAGSYRRDRRVAGDRGVLVRMVQSLHLPRRVARGGHALVDYAEGTDLWPDWRHCCRRHDVFAGTTWW